MKKIAVLSLFFFVHHLGDQPIIQDAVPSLQTFLVEGKEIDTINLVLFLFSC